MPYYVRMSYIVTQAFFMHFSYFSKYVGIELIPTLYYFSKKLRQILMRYRNQRGWQTRHA